MALTVARAVARAVLGVRFVLSADFAVDSCTATLHPCPFTATTATLRVHCFQHLQQFEHGQAQEYIVTRLRSWQRLVTVLI